MEVDRPVLLRHGVDANCPRRSSSRPVIARAGRLTSRPLDRPPATSRIVADCPITREIPAGRQTGDEGRLGAVPQGGQLRRREGSVPDPRPVDLAVVAPDDEDLGGLVVLLVRARDQQRRVVDPQQVGRQRFARPARPPRGPRDAAAARRPTARRPSPRRTSRPRNTTAWPPGAARRSAARTDLEGEPTLLVEDQPVARPVCRAFGQQPLRPPIRGQRRIDPRLQGQPPLQPQRRRVGDQTVGARMQRLVAARDTRPRRPSAPPGRRTWAVSASSGRGRDGRSRLGNSAAWC